jgi:hypothetical protein
MNMAMAMCRFHPIHPYRSLIYTIPWRGLNNYSDIMPPTLVPSYIYDRTRPGCSCKGAGRGVWVWAAHCPCRHTQNTKMADWDLGHREGKIKVRNSPCKHTPGLQIAEFWRAGETPPKETILSQTCNMRVQTPHTPCYLSATWLRAAGASAGGASEVFTSSGSSSRAVFVSASKGACRKHPQGLPQTQPQGASSDPQVTVHGRRRNALASYP